VGGPYLTPAKIDPNWRIVSIADFNRDGFVDLAFRYQTTGQLAVWYMAEAVMSSGASMNPGAVADPSWVIVGPR
jgi:hypothetical protein